MKKILLVLLTIVCVSFGFAADVVKVGVILPLTGNISGFGDVTLRGIKIANELYPTILGKKVQLVIIDTKSDKVESANAARRAIEVDKVIGMLGEVASSNTLSAGAVAEELKVPLLSGSSTNPLVTQGKKFTSRVCFIDPFQGLAAAKLAWDTLKVKKVAIFLDVEQDYAVGLANFFKKTYEPKGGKIITENYKSGDQDFTVQINDAISKGAEAFFIPGYYQEISMIAIQAKQLGFKGKLMAGDGADAPELIKIGGDAVNGLYFTTHYHPDSPAVTDNAKKFLAYYMKKYKEKPSTLTALGYDTYMVLMDAIKRANSFDTVKIAEQIRKTNNFQGASGTFTIGASGDPVKSVTIIKVDKGVFKFDSIIKP